MLAKENEMGEQFFLIHILGANLSLRMLDLSFFFLGGGFGGWGGYESASSLLHTIWLSAWPGCLILFVSSFYLFLESPKVAESLGPNIIWTKKKTGCRWKEG